MPPFALEGGLPLALSRGIWVACLLSCFGTLAFRAMVAPRALARAEGLVVRRVDRALLRLGWTTTGLAACTLLLWLLLQSDQIAGAGDAVAEVLWETTFGHVVLLQLLALAATAALLGAGRRWSAAGSAAVTTALQAGHGHAMAMVDGPSLLLGATALHLLAAGAWLGGLLPLLLIVRVAPARTAAAAARWFSPLGAWCVALLAGSAVIQFWQLIGGVPGVVGTAYGWTASLKLAVFAVLLGFAWLNRYRFAPRLLDPAADKAGPVLLRSIAMQTGFGLLVVLSASILSTLPPAIHEQPVWPFPQRPSLVALADPDLRAEVMRGALELLAGVVLALAGLAAWRRRWLALAGIAAGVAVGGASATHLDLLLVDAYPTSYYRSPTGFAATGIARGEALFPANCAGCHGGEGRGDGPAAAHLPVPPADLTAEHLWAHDDGELFWWLSHGMEAPDGGMAMPGFAPSLSEDDRWALIDFIRAHNAGVGLRDRDRWLVPVQAPTFTMACPGNLTIGTEDLRGSVLHLVAMPPGGGPIPASPERSPVPVVTVLLTHDRLAADPAACTTADPAVWTAYAAISGIPAAELAGAQFLVDGDGWMRAAQRPAETIIRWADPALLLADIQAICGHPLAAPSAGHHH